MKRLVRVVRKIALWSAGIAAILAALVLLVNSRQFDEAPNPEIAAFVRFEASGVPDAQNAYLHLLGLGAPEAEEPHAAGRKWLAAANDVQARRMKGEFVKWPGPLGAPPRLPEKLCDKDFRACLAQAKENPDSIRKLVAANERLLVRYRAAHAYPGYAEPTDGVLFDYPQTVYPFFPVVHRLFLMDAALRLHQGDLEAVMADLGKDIVLARRMLAGSRSLIGKLVAGAHLSRDVLFASEVLASHRERAGAAALEWQKLLRPLAPVEWQMGDSIRHEFRGTTAGIDNLMKYPSQFMGGDFWTESWLERSLFQPNATFNYLYQVYKPEYDAARVPAIQVNTALPKRAPESADPVLWTLLYDPTGKTQVRPNFFGDFSDYIRRMHDLDALVRLAALQAGIVAQGIQDEDVSQFIAAADKLFANPWTEKPMQWDSRARQIYFTPNSKRYLGDKIGGVAGRTGLTL